MSESTAETQILVQTPIKETPNFQVVEQSGEEIATQKLKEAIINPNLGIDQTLDIFENDYIPNFKIFDPLRDHKPEIMLFIDLPNKMVSDPSFSGDIIDLSSANDQRLVGLPEFIKENLKAFFNRERGPDEYRKFPEDPRWKRYWELVGKYSEKALNIAKTNSETLESFGYPGSTDEYRFQNLSNWWWSNRGSSYTWFLDEVKEKSAGKDLISSGEWLGHGTFLVDVEKMLEKGGKIKSAYHVLNSGGEREDMYGMIKGGDAHKAFIFFYHWKHEDYRYPVDLVGRYGTMVNNQPTESNVGVFYPVDAIYRNGLTIGSYLGDKSTSEFFVTKSPNLISEERRFSKDEIIQIAKSDQTELPLDQAFFRVGDSQKYEEIKSLFLKFGYEGDWVSDHIYFQKPGSGREELRGWLKSRPYARAQIPPHKPVKYSENNYLWEPVK